MMRTKAQILNDSLGAQSKIPERYKIESLHEQLTIEVLIDIRDILHKDIAQIIEDLNLLANKY